MKYVVRSRQIVKLYFILLHLCLVWIWIYVFPSAAYSEIGDMNCFAVKELEKPEVERVISMSPYFETPWEEQRGNLAEELYGNKSFIIPRITAWYKSSDRPFFFFLEDFALNPCVGILMEVVDRLRILENISFPERDSVDKAILEVERLRAVFERYSQPSELPKDVMLCPSQHMPKKFFLSKMSIPGEQEQALLKWAYQRFQYIEELTLKATRADMLLTALYIRYYLIIRPWDIPKPLNYSVLTSPDCFREYLLSLHPSNYHYQNLNKLIELYWALRSQKQTFLDVPLPIKAGASGDPIFKLQARLREEGYLSNEHANGIFDETTKKAVITFQHEHNLEQDGIVGPKTLSALNISYATKYKWIKESLRRMRFFLKDTHEPMVWVNIPTFSLEYYRNGDLVSRHKVIVGAAWGKTVNIKGLKVGINNTLPMSSEINAVVVNPRWYVPERIRKELEKEISSRPNYLEEEQFRLLDSQYSWGSPRIYQLPGETNPLGKVKFLFANPFGIFLHDTSQPRLFRRVFRAFSHGCVRVENALDLARLILFDAAPHQYNKLDVYLERNDQTYIMLPNPIAIYITYIPVLSTEAGKPIFGGDPYGWGFDESTPVFLYTKQRS